MLKDFTCGRLTIIIGRPYRRDLPRIRTLGIFISQLKLIGFILKWRKNFRSTAFDDKDIIVTNVLTTEM